MNRLKLIELLSSSSEEEVFVKADEDGLLDDFEIEHIGQQLDGFDDVSPACIAIKAKRRDNNGYDNEQWRWE